MSKENGGNVHPTMTMSDEPGCYHLYQSEGMDVRTYLAAKCDVSLYTPLGNLERDLGRKPTVGELAEYIANVRLIEADAILRELAK